MNLSELLTPALAALMAVGALAFLVKGVTGAGAGIVFNTSMLLLLSLGWAGSLTLKDGLYWMALAELTTSVALLWQLRRQVRPDRLTLGVLVTMVPTAFVFALLLPALNLAQLKPLLAFAIIFAGVYLVWSAGRPIEGTVSKTALLWAPVVGLFAGVLAGLFGMGGPVFLVLLGRYSKTPSIFRQRSLVIAASMHILRVGVFFSQGVYTSERLVSYLPTAPIILVALIVGSALHSKISPLLFRRGLGTLVMLSGALIIVKAVFFR